MRDIAVFPVDRLDLVFRPKPWPFAEQRRSEIDAHFAKMQHVKPALWNERVLLMYRQVMAEGVFRGEFLETDYASFAAWTAWGQPKAGVHDCFGAAAVIAADNAVLLGKMAPHTFNAGRIYFPCGTPDPDDIVGGKVDFDGSARRELREETGLDAAKFTAEPGWATVVDGPLIAHLKVLRGNEDAEALRARMMDHLRSEKQPELADILIVRGPDDFHPAMPRYVTAFLEAHFGASPQPLAKSPPGA
jgi:8-oxo-dGTP pyrophosphatase MutT (NUDIX family)